MKKLDPFSGKIIVVSVRKPHKWLKTARLFKNIRKYIKTTISQNNAKARLWSLIREKRKAERGKETC